MHLKSRFHYRKLSLGIKKKKPLGELCTFLPQCVKYVSNNDFIAQNQMVELRGSYYFLLKFKDCGYSSHHWSHFPALTLK